MIRCENSILKVCKIEYCSHNGEHPIGLHEFDRDVEIPGTCDVEGHICPIHGKVKCLEVNK